MKEIDSSGQGDAGASQERQGWNIAGIDEELGGRVVLPLDEADPQPGAALAVNGLLLHVAPATGTVHLTGDRIALTIWESNPPLLEPGGVVFANDRFLLSLRAEGDFILHYSPLARSTDQPSSTDRLAPWPPETANVAGQIRQPGSNQPGPAKERQPTARIEGLLTHDPVYRVTANQKSVCEFVVAEHYTDQTGEERTVFHRCATFNNAKNKLADKVRDSGRKGDSIVVRGYWHDVPIRFSSGQVKVERQLWAFAVKVTPADPRN